MGDILNLSDFQSIEMTATFRNLTSGTTTAKSDMIRVVEIGEHSLSLEGPARACVRGHHLQVQMTVRNPSDPRPIEFPFSGKVEHVESLDLKLARIDLTLVQFDSDTWQKIRDLMNARQDAVLEFLRNVRGVG